MSRFKMKLFHRLPLYWPKCKASCCRRFLAVCIAYHNRHIRLERTCDLRLENKPLSEPRLMSTWVRRVGLKPTKSLSENFCWQEKVGNPWAEKQYHTFGDSRTPNWMVCWSNKRCLSNKSTPATVLWLKVEGKFIGSTCPFRGGPLLLACLNSDSLPW